MDSVKFSFRTFYLFPILARLKSTVSSVNTSSAMEIRSRLSLSCFYRVFRNCKQWHKKHSCSLQNRHSHRQLSSESGDVDLELSYTTYPDQEHSQVSTKKPLLFVHGLFGAKGNLHSVSKHLSNDGQKVVTYDARNHGDSQHSPKMDYISMADDLDGLITDLSLKDPVVMGHSMGGKTAMTLALTKPERMSALIVVDITPSTNDTRELYKYAQAMKNVQIPSGVSIIQARKNVEAQLSAVVTHRAVLQFLLTNLREFPSGELRWRMNLNAIINNFDKITQFPDLSSKQFIKPTLFIFGANSPHYRSVQMDVIKSFFPQVQVTVIKEAAHFVHADKPLEFVAAVKTFLSSIEESAV